jgi:NADH pyrophosphatase NudC (nudix superfamily)
VIREALEETACTFKPESLIGIYLWKKPDSDLTYLRAAFCGVVSTPDPHRQLDTGIERAIWLRRDEILQREAQWRSPLVLRCIDDYITGKRHPLDALVSLVGHE